MPMLSVPIAKAGNAMIEVDPDSLPDEMYKLVFAEGLKAVLNKRMSKVGSVSKLEGEEREKAHASALAIANENLEALREGKLKSAGAKTAKVSGIIMTEARRLAKEVVKNAIKAAGQKVSHVEASAITAAANVLIKDDPSYLDQAKANIEARATKVPAGDTPEAKEAAQSLLASIGGIAISEKKKAAAEKAAAEKKTQLSKTQAGITKKVPARAVPAAHHAH